MSIKNAHFSNEERAKNVDSRRNEIFLRIAASALLIFAMVPFNRRCVSLSLMIKIVFTVKHMS